MTESTKRLMALECFSGEFKPDPRGAAAALRAVGYEVFPLPDKLRPLLGHKRDDSLRR
jgi:hypothetical protein